MKFYVQHGSMATRLFSEANQIRSITHGPIEIEVDGGQWTLGVYRESSAVPGWFSRESYKIENDRWKRESEDAQKYPRPPAIPEGATAVHLNTFRVWCDISTPPDVLEELRRKLSLPGFSGG